MPIKDAGKKDVRQNERRQVRNLRKKRELHDLIQDFDNAIKDEKFAEAEQMLPTIQKKLDKASNSFLKRGRAQRKVSRLNKRLNTAKASA
ncbi:MAG: 30S ribosomal protein S20 [Candidatus Doudnabacteria bacterium]|nr:30S ribosomal protein S20 [Candidatus Doudnabacteria bacterium]MCA9387542.1 30S ribosomal protein S20 [Candidatus Andersenbacteria bacterium]